jgi:nicotinamidase-related amidase
MDTPSLDPRTTALVVIDLQKGIVSRQTAPHASQDVVERACRLADRFRQLKAPVVLVRVAYSADGRDRLASKVDAAPWSAATPPDFSDLVPAMGPKDGDIVVTKRNWGAFYGTELDLQLRRRGVRTIVLAGISTNFGVESTARDAFERAYQLVFAEDAMAGPSAEAHQFAVTQIFPRLGLVRKTEEVLKTLGG